MWGIIISISLYGYINLNHKATHLKEPLMIVSTDEHEGVLELNLLGSTERLINWINTVEAKDPSRRIEIEDIERKGNVVYVHCAVKPTMRP